MNFREMLKSEVWSKRTTRKLLQGLGIVISIAVMVLGPWYLFEKYWITQGERSAAKAALIQIDAMQNFNSISDQDFIVMASQAQARVKSMQESAVTSRDLWVVQVAGLYLSATETNRTSKHLENLMKGKPVRMTIVSADGKVRDADEMDHEIANSCRSRLHKALN